MKEAQTYLFDIQEVVTEWEKVFASDRTGKELIPKTYKQPMQLNSKQTTQLKNEQKM